MGFKEEINLLADSFPSKGKCFLRTGVNALATKDTIRKNHAPLLHLLPHIDAHGTLPIALTAADT
jgi:hypothetical protein